MALTDVQCRGAKCPDGKPRERYTDSGGLYLEVLPSGTKRWRWKYRFDGKEKRLALGIYPAVGLSQARRDRDAAREVLRSGRDPVAAKLEARVQLASDQANNFEAAAREWWAGWSPARSSRHADHVLRRLEADVFPVIGSTPLPEITAPKLLAMAKKIETRGALDIAKRALQTSGQILRFAVAHGKLERNPAADVKPADALKPRRKSHYARLDVKQLPELLRKMRAYVGSPYTRYAMELMALTFVRTGELIAARWDEFDLEAAEWRIPAERMKMKTPHIVPLSRQAVEHLRCLKEIRGGGLLFPGERDHEKPMSNNTILKALERMGFKGRMTGHGFRGVASTMLHEMGFDHAHIELQLAHMERDDTSAAYNFATYLPQRRKMMQAYADQLDRLRTSAKATSLEVA